MTAGQTASSAWDIFGRQHVHVMLTCDTAFTVKVEQSALEVEDGAVNLDEA